MLTNAAGTTWMPPSRWCALAARRRRLPLYGPKPRSSVFLTKKHALLCNTVTVSALLFGKSLSSAVSFRSTVPGQFSREWSSHWKHSGLPRTGGGWRAAPIEEDSVVTETGHEVITRLPAEELLVAGAHYVTVNGPLPTTRESDASGGWEVVDLIQTSAKTEGVKVSD